MFKKILLVLIVIIGAFAVYVHFQPADYRVVRTATMAATPDTIFENVSDFHKWEAWSPWEKLDPNMKKTIEGTTGKVGSTYAWVGNDKVGEGKLTLTEAKAPDALKFKLEFIKPHAATSDTDFNFKGDGEKTQVTWTMVGTKDYMSKAVCIFMNMDKMIGDDFEKGLASLKGVVEGKK